MGYVNPRRFVTFVRDHKHVTPATILTSIEPRTGVETHITDIPERVCTYYAGQEIDMGSVARAKEFTKAHNTYAGQVVCVQGRV